MLKKKIDLIFFLNLLKINKIVLKVVLSHLC